jgi:methionine sulfoxide reductase heme-binding subunit
VLRINWAIVGTWGREDAERSRKSFFVWALCLPILPMLMMPGQVPDDRLFHILVHPSGEWSARLLILTLSVTPLMLMFPTHRWPRWLMKQRRYFGVAAFGCAVLHTIFYLIDKGAVSSVVAEFTRPYIWLGWLAFIVFVPLAITSTDGWVRRLGPRWKTLQRLSYAAAVLTLLHWAALHNWNSAGHAILNFAPLIGLQAYRGYWLLNRKRRRAARVAV